MNQAPCWPGFLCLLLALVPARPLIVAGGAAKAQTPMKVSFCDLLAHPAAFSGRVVVVTVRIDSFKEGARLWSPECSKKGLRLWIESDYGPGIPELRRILLHPDYGHPLVATLTGTFEPHHYDEITHRTRPVFKVVAARDIKRSRNVERR